MVQDKHYQHKLQVMLTSSASEAFVLIDDRKNTTSARCRGSRASWALVGVECSTNCSLWWLSDSTVVLSM